MSIQAVAWVLEQSRSRGFSRLVLISLANHHNAGTGQCNPGQRLIASEAGISPGSVPEQIRKLVELGEVEVANVGGSHRSTEYRLTFAQHPSKDDPEFAQEPSELPGVRSADPPSTRGIAPSTRGPEPRGTREPSEPHRASRARGSNGRRTDPRSDALVRAWWERFNPRPVQPWPAAVAVVSRALSAGWEPEQIATALRQVDPPLSGGKLDAALSRNGARRVARRGGSWDDVAARDASVRQ